MVAYGGGVSFLAHHVELALGDSRRASPAPECPAVLPLGSTNSVRDVNPEAYTAISPGTRRPVAVAPLASGTHSVRQYTLTWSGKKRGGVTADAERQGNW